VPSVYAPGLPTLAIATLEADETEVRQEMTLHSGAEESGKKSEVAVSIHIMQQELATLFQDNAI
jgi:hypothetical protein